MTGPLRVAVLVLDRCWSAVRAVCRPVVEPVVAPLVRRWELRELRRDEEVLGHLRGLAPGAPLSVATREFALDIAVRRRRLGLDKREGL